MKLSKYRKLNISSLIIFYDHQKVNIYIHTYTMTIYEKPHWEKSLTLLGTRHYLLLGHVEYFEWCIKKELYFLFLSKRRDHPKHRMAINIFKDKLDFKVNHTAMGLCLWYIMLGLVCHQVCEPRTPLVGQQQRGVNTVGVTHLDRLNNWFCLSL